MQVSEKLTAHRNADLQWWTRPIPVQLQSFVRSWSGYEERTPAPLQRREYPSVQVVVIFEFGPPIRIYDYGSEDRFSTFTGGFVAGLHDRFSLTEHLGYQSGFQLNLTPIGARAFFGIPMSELQGRVVRFTDLMDGELRHFNEELAGLPWTQRFDLIEQHLLLRLNTGPSIPHSLLWAYGQITNSEQPLETRELADELGYSQKHLISLFKKHVGITPTRLRRISRFDRFMQLAQNPERMSGLDIIDRLGFYDQSHLIHDVNEMTGLSPTAFLRQR